MTAPKQEARKIIDSLPEDTSYDEILKELAFDRMIQRGLKDSQDNKTISNQEMKNRQMQLAKLHTIKPEIVDQIFEKIIALSIKEQTS